MTNRYASTNNTASADLAADHVDYRDKKVLQHWLLRAHLWRLLTAIWKAASATNW